MTRPRLWRMATDLGLHAPFRILRVDRGKSRFLCGEWSDGRPFAMTALDAEVSAASLFAAKEAVCEAAWEACLGCLPGTEGAGI